MIGYRELWAADPGAWRAAGAAWGGVAGLAQRRTTELTETAGTLRAGWSGPAGQAADGRLRHLAAELSASRPAFAEAEQILAEYAARLSRAKALLDATVRAAAPAGVRIDRDGGVSADPAGARPTEPGAVSRVAAGIRGALDLAAAADRDAARRLADLAGAVGPGWTAPPPAGRPAPGADPALVRRWWAGLTAAQRRWLIGHEPALAGRLDGIPAGDRDQANRLLLAQRRAELLAERARLTAGPLTGPADPTVAARVARLDRTLAGLDAVEDRLTGTADPRAYLLRLDPAGDGRAVLALGNPDQADNVLTYVPGMTSDLPGIAGELGRAERMAARCAELGPTEQTSVVLWLDYDAPRFLDEAARAGQAEQAGPALHRFQEGLRATHEGGPAQQTVVGHSYGSLVVGSTARDHGLAADQVVFVGSPGVGVDRAAELNLPAGRVWATTAGDDVIRYGPEPAQAAGRLALSAFPVVGPLLAFGRPADDLWFGADPSGSEFGARVFRGDDRGHLGYWDAGNPALDGIARIVLDGHTPSR